MIYLLLNSELRHTIYSIMGYLHCRWSLNANNCHFARIYTNGINQITIIYGAKWATKSGGWRRNFQTLFLGCLFERLIKSNTQIHHIMCFVYSITFRYNDNNSNIHEATTILDRPHFSMCFGSIQRQQHIGSEYI